MNKVLLICLGNICRSPMAEGVVRKVLDDAGLTHVETDSAGTSGWHIGDAPDPRAVKAALMRDIDISHQRCRQVSEADFADFDLLIAMDGNNYAKLKALQPEGARGRVHLLLEFAGDLPVREVPDPYYGGEQGFDHALDLIEQGAKGLADYIARASG